MRRRAAALRVRLCGSSSTASVAVLNGMRSPIAPNLCDALRAARPAFEADQRGLRRFPSNRMSSSGELFTAGPPAIATCCAIHKRLPPALEPGGGAPPLSIYWPLSFLAHAAEIAPARITVIDSAMLASRVSSVRFHTKSRHPDYSKLLSGETFLGS